MSAVLTERELSEAAVGEEANEVGIELSKAKRFGWNGINPKDGTTPAYRIAVEIGDLLGSIEFLLETHPEIPRDEIAYSAMSKRAKLLFWNETDNHTSQEGPPV